MKKIVAILIFMLSVTSLSAQKYVEVLKKGICDCVEANQGQVNFENVMNVCFETTSLEQLIDEAHKKGEIGMSLDSINKRDGALGEKMIIQMMTDLIVECDGMYKVFDDLRERMRTEKRSQKSMQHLDSLNQIQMTDKKELFDRGILNFSYHKYDKGIEDLKASLNNTKDDSRALFTIGWIYEKKEDYKTALNYYNQASSMINDPEILLFIKAMAAKMKQ